eukprot:358229-Chlamydomonas_euryale.AAC.20
MARVARRPESHDRAGARIRCSAATGRRARRRASCSLHHPTLSTGVDGLLWRPHGPICMMVVHDHQGTARHSWQLRPPPTPQPWSTLAAEGMRGRGSKGTRSLRRQRWAPRPALRP